MTAPRTYPEGVTSWVDLEVPDVEEAIRFYGRLFGWTFADAAPPEAPFRYVIAQLDGADAAAVATAEPGAPVAWNTYISVDDADAAAARVESAGGSVVARPADAGEGGRMAACTDPSGVAFRLWQPRRRLGVQVTNAPGAWNFSDLHAADPAASIAFYQAVFGWQVDDIGFGQMIRVRGYGDHLQATVDPTIHDRQTSMQAPPGFADAIGWVNTVSAGEEPHWHVTFTVEDRDASTAEVQRLGGTVLEVADTDWTRHAVVRDPFGAGFTVSQYAGG